MPNLGIGMVFFGQAEHTLAAVLVPLVEGGGVRRLIQQEKVFVFVKQKASDIGFFQTLFAKEILFFKSEAVYLIPVDAGEEGIDVIGPFILKLQVVGMFPHIDAQEGFSLYKAIDVHQGIVLVWS